MAQMVIFVLNDIEHCPAVLDAWEAAGISGITILESTGLGRVRDNVLRDDLPLMPSLVDMLQSRELRHRTLFSVIDDSAVLERVIAATEAIVGDLNQPHTGLLIVLPVTRVLGLHREQTDSQQNP